MRYLGKLQLPEDQIYRLLVEFDDNTVDLGILTSDGIHFCINTRIVAKKLGKGEPVFRIVLHDNQSVQFVAINAMKKFEYIALLPGSVLCCEHGKIGIILPSDQGVPSSAATESK